MNASELLSAIKESNLHDDEARILLAVGMDYRRFFDIMDKTRLKESQFRKMLDNLQMKDLLYKEEAGNGAAGRGKCTVYSLTADGIMTVRKLLNESTGGESKRPIPPGMSLSIVVRSSGNIGFLAG